MAATKKVKILKHCQNWKPGDIVEVPAPLAAAMCHLRHVHDGTRLVEHRVAISLEEAEKMDQAIADLPAESLTAAQMAALGRKNIVPTPGVEAPALAEGEEGAGDEKEPADEKPKGKAKKAPKKEAPKPEAPAEGGEVA